MTHPSLKTSLLTLGILTIPIFAYFIWSFTTTPATLSMLPRDYTKAGQSVKEDLELLPALPITETETTYEVKDTKEGIDIQFASATEETLKTEETPKLTLAFPKDYAEPIQVKLDPQRIITITDLSGGDGYTSDSLKADSLPREEQGFFARLFDTETNNAPSQYLRYTSDDERKSLLYAFQKDQATGEKQLKHWTLYASGTGLETEEYKIENAKVKIVDGKAEVFYFGEKDIQNEAVKAEVDGNLLERAQRTLAKEMGEDILNGSQSPDFVIPEPYYLDKAGEQHTAEWKWNEEAKTLSVTLTVSVDQYPIALDPTLSFTAPGVSNGGSAITGESGAQLGISMIAGDFNADGKTDLAIGANRYTTFTGRTHIFYQDGSIPTTAATADVTITGETTSNRFGSALAAGDFNLDGKTDLAIGAHAYSSNTGRVYIFHNDGSYPTSASGADVTITGNATSDRFGFSLAAGDFNSDGKTDLTVGGYGYSSNTGRAYIFHNDGSIPTTAATADVTITGNATSDLFGYTLTVGDFNADGRTDLTVGAYGYSSNTGRAYIFHNDGSIPTTAGTADVTITGEGTSNNFGYAFTAGDFNSDGRTDLAVGAYGYSSNTGRAYIFHNDGSIPTTAGTADVTITGNGSMLDFGASLTSGDFNIDGRIDLVVAAIDISLSRLGATYFFYNDGSIPTAALVADVIITGESAGGDFGISFATGDFNADGKTDLAVGAASFALFTGRTYIFYSQNGQVNTNIAITGNATGDRFGHRFTAGDLNADGRTDLVVGAYAYSSNTGRAYIFYNDGTYPTGASSADVTITGNAAGDYFGNSLTVGDFNGDARTDLVVGAQYYSSSTGRAYIFYNDGSIPTTAATADLTITGEASSEFGNSFAVGDLNADGQPDLIVGARQYGSSTGRVYIFHNDGSIPTTAATANVTITGDYGYFGGSLAVGDFNSDGETDLAVGENAADGYRGAAYLFYNDGSIPTTAATADLKIAGTTNISEFASTMVSGDFNADNRVDLAVGAWYEANGAVYLFYNDGSIPTTAATADTIITGEPSSGGSFSLGLNAGDFNADGRTDLVVGAYGRTHPDGGSEAGRAYIFYNDGAYPATATNADLFLATGESGGNHLGLTFGVGDFNADGRTDIAVGANRYSSDTGRVYIYETRENFAWEIQRQPQTTTTSSARTGINGSGQEIQITGETSSKFGYAMSSGDFNADGKTDLVVGAPNHNSNIGRVYIFYSDGSLVNSSVNADVVITGESSTTYFGGALAAGDFNADGKTDLISSAYMYNGPNRLYIFHNDGSIPTTAATADTIVAAGDFDNFATMLAAGDLNADGRTDIIAGSPLYNDRQGRIHILYNDGTYPTLASSADVIITGQSTFNQFGRSLAVGDFNADGEIDLATGAPEYSSSAGRAYFFYNDGAYPSVAASADVIIEAPSAGDAFGNAAAAGDFNRDGKTDIAFAATTGGGAADGGEINIFYNDGSYPAAASSDDLTISSSTSGAYFGTTLIAADVNVDGWTDIIATGDETLNSAYLFYNDGSIPTAITSADMIITGEVSSDYFGRSFAVGDFSGDGKNDLAVGADLYSSDRGRVYVYTFNDPVITGQATANYFGYSVTSGDFNADGKVDLAVGAISYSSGAGRAYIFYSDGSYPSAAASADVLIDGQSGSSFGISMAAGDFNADGRTDLAVGAWEYSSYTGRAYIFYNDGSIPTTAASADVIITGEASSGFTERAMIAADFNADGRTDLAIGARYYSSFNQTGRVYILYNDGSIPTTAASADVIITGEATSSQFGFSLASGDLNFDGRTDLIVGAANYSRAYIFYSDGSYPSAAASADVTITGEASSYFGYSLTAGDFNADGKTDLVVGAYGYSSNTGRAYIFYSDGSIPTTAVTADVIITGASSGGFGFTLASGDLNADGRTDLVVSTSQSPNRVHIFYNDGTFSETVAGADSGITLAGSSLSGPAFTVFDAGNDGRSDLIVGENAYSSDTGRVYVFTSEAAPTSAVPGVMKVKGTSSLKGNVRWK